MEFLHTSDIPYLVNALLRLVILIFFVALLALFAGLGIQKRRLALRAEEDHERINDYAQQLSAIDAGTRWQIDPLESMRDLICLGRAYRQHCEMRPDGVAFRLDTSRYAKQVDLLKQGLSARNWGRRYQAIDTIANLRLHSLFDFLLQHSLTEKNNSVASHCLHVCALLLRSGEEFEALANRLDHDDQLSTNLVEGLSRSAIQQLKKNQPDATVQAHLTTCLRSASYGMLFKIGLINAIGKEQLLSLKDVLVALATEGSSDVDAKTAVVHNAAHTKAQNEAHNKTHNEAHNEAHIDDAVTLAVMRAIANCGQYDAVIRRQLNSDQPTMQVVALRSSLHCDDESLTLVAQQLHSLHFDVRYAAAMTLEKMGARGQHLLKTARMGTDRYAKNIASFALAIG